MSGLKINIFGVGRSGTKSLQLFIAYGLLQKYATIQLNYEPYFWATRLLGVKSFEGIGHHLNTKHFTDKTSDFSNKHQQYLRKMSAADVVVNKFIRANGRTKPITEITGANYNLFLVRDQEGVLNSVDKQSFDFTSIGSRFKINYKENFLKDAKDVGLTLRKNDSDNQMVWRAYNEYARRDDNLIEIAYERLNDPNYLSQKLSFLELDKNLFEQYANLRGNQIHNESVLKNQAKIDNNSLSDKVKFYSLFRLNRRTSFSNQKLGDVVRLA